MPGLPARYYPALWGEAYATAEEAIEAFRSGLEPGATVAVIPEGPYVLAKARSQWSGAAT
ncbi:MAG: hypothetical protein GY953_29340 [bacterium]|nr:hypothetical protein [bacterium]